MKTSKHFPQHEQIWIVGAGNMAFEYAKILEFLQKNFHIIVRNKHKRKNFENLKFCKIIDGDLNFALDNYLKPSFCIICTNVTNLFDTTKILLKKKVKNLLVEKPGLLKLQHVEIIKKLMTKNNNNIFYAFNRRFLPSIVEMLKRLDLNGSPLALHVEISERWHLIPKEKKEKLELQKWGISNSIHIIDLIQIIAGEFKTIKSFKKGGFFMHPSGSQFSFSGETHRDIVFSGISSWGSAGGWSVEVFSKNFKYILKPIEVLHEINNTNFNSTIIVDNEVQEFKSGLKPLLENFLNCNFNNLCTIEELETNIKFANKVYGY